MSGDLGFSLSEQAEFFRKQAAWADELASLSSDNEERLSWLTTAEELKRKADDLESAH